RFVDIWYAMPFLMVALIVTLIFGRGLTVLLFVLALIAWTSFVRVVRAEVMVLKSLDYVAAARVNGASDFRILFRHLMPGILNTAIVVGTLNTSGLILAESVLSFVGAGIQPPTPAWGVMTTEGRDYLTIAAHQVLVPSTAIFMVVISLNFLGDWLRDRLDPRLRQID
ncbi:MAG: ABC transporter permease, partial [SAR202 cluster bacterium]|nr:ABC transporter permease [SAR202 cluster bacterium]